MRLRQSVSAAATIFTCCRMPILTMIAKDAHEAAKVGERRRDDLHVLADAEPHEVREGRHRGVARRPDHAVTALYEQLGEPGRVLSRGPADERVLLFLLRQAPNFIREPARTRGRAGRAPSGAGGGAERARARSAGPAP